MSRRAFISLLSGAAAARPLAARAQQTAMPVVGFLGTASAGPFAHLVAGLRRGLQETGFIDRRNVALEYRWAEGQYDRPQKRQDARNRASHVAAATRERGDRVKRREFITLRVKMRLWYGNAMFRT